MLRTVLIVDDDAVTLKLLKEGLSSAGYDVVEARTGQQALDQAMRQPVDAVVMDILLPDMEGSEVIAKMKDQERFKDVRVVFLSGIISRIDGADPEVVAGGQNYPAISKPVDFRVLFQLLSEEQGNY